MKTKLAKSGNVAIFEYPEIDNPKFKLDKNGVLFIFGYDFSIGDKKIGAAKRFELGLKGYTAIGKYKDAEEIIEGDLQSILIKANINPNNALILIKDETLPLP